MEQPREVLTWSDFDTSVWRAQRPPSRIAADGGRGVSDS